MRYSQARLGRIFVVRLEDGEILHEKIEELAMRENIRAAALIALGGADAGSGLVVGPRAGRARPIEPMQLLLEDVHEIAGVGTIFPDASGRPVLHMHAAAGRKSEARTGCVRAGVKVWHVTEVVVFELTGTEARRLREEASGFELLSP